MAEINDWVDVPLTQNDEIDDWEDMPVDKVGGIEAGFHGIGQGLTFGFSDEILAGVTTGFGLFDDYEKVRDEYRQRVNQAKADSPAAFTVGELGGGVASAFIPGIGAIGNVGKAATIGGKIAAGAKAGAVAGGLQAAGTSEGETLGEIASDVGQGAILGGTLGGVIGGVTGGLSKIVDKGLQKADDIKVSPKVVDLRYDAMSKTPTQIKKGLASETGKIQGLQDAVEHTSKMDDIWTSNVDSTTKNVNEKLKKVGHSLSEIGKGVDEMFHRTMVEEYTGGPEVPISLIEELKMLVRKEGQELFESGKLSASESKRFMRDKNNTLDLIKLRLEKDLEKPLAKQQNPIQIIRELKINKAQKLTGADFQFGGTKAGSAKDRLKSEVQMLSDIEKGMVDSYEKILENLGAYDPEKIKTLVSKEGLENIGDYKRLLDDYKNLKKLQDYLTSTGAKSEKFIDDLSIGGGLIGGMILGGVGTVPAIANIAHKFFTKTSTGKLIRANAIKKGEIAVDMVNKIAKKQNIPVETLRDYLDSYGVKIIGRLPSMETNK